MTAITVGARVRRILAGVRGRVTVGFARTPLGPLAAPAPGLGTGEAPLTALTAGAAGLLCAGEPPPAAMADAAIAGDGQVPAGGSDGVRAPADGRPSDDDGAAPSDATAVASGSALNIGADGTNGSDAGPAAAPSPPVGDGGSSGAPVTAEASDEGSAPPARRSRLRRLAGALRKQPGWLVAVLLAGAFGQVEAHLFSPIINGVVSAYDGLTGQHPLGTPAAQLDAIAGRAQQQGFTVSSTSVGFAFGPNANVMILSPRDPATSTRSAELRVYAIPTSGPVRLLFDFRPEPIAPTPTRGNDTPLDQVFAPRTFGLRVRAVARFNGSPGLQVLVDLYDPREPAIEVLPLLLSQDLSNDRFVLEPLLSPATTGRGSMSDVLSARYVATGNWADTARTTLYERPIAIRNAAQPDVVLRSFAVSGYGISTTTPFDTNGGVLTLAAGYAVRGGDFPTPTVMQILVWHVDLTITPPTARTFSGVPDFAQFSPSAPTSEIQAALDRAAQGLPPSSPPSVQ